jgi:hypothetical protein
MLFKDIQPWFGAITNKIANTKAHIAIMVFCDKTDRTLFCRFSPIFINKYKTINDVIITIVNKGSKMTS